MPKIKAKPVATKIYAVVGSDDVEIKRAAAEIAEKLKSPDAGEFGLETIDVAAAGKQKQPKWFLLAPRNGNSNSRTTRSNSSCFSPAAIPARSRTNWKRSTSTWAKIARWMSILSARWCRSRAKVSFLI